MTEKHFKAIAQILKARIAAARDWGSDSVPGSTRDHESEAVVTYLTIMAQDLADYFASENPRFKRDKFLKSCGLGD